LESHARVWLRQKYPKHDPDAVFAALIRHGLIESHAGQCHLTDAGRKLRTRKFVPPLPRAAADALLADVVRRVNHVNADDRFVSGFTFLGVFGSYLDPSRTELGDLDLFFELGLKPNWSAALDVAENPSAIHSRMREHHLRHFPRDDYRAGAVFMGMRRRPVMFVRNRRPHVSMHGRADYVWLVGEKGVQFKTILGSPPSLTSTESSAAGTGGPT